MIGVYKIETEVVSGSGKFERAGLGTCRETKESMRLHLDISRLIAGG